MSEKDNGNIDDFNDLFIASSDSVLSNKERVAYNTSIIDRFTGNSYSEADAEKCFQKVSDELEKLEEEVGRRKAEFDSQLKAVGNIKKSLKDMQPLYEQRYEGMVDNCREYISSSIDGLEAIDLDNLRDLLNSASDLGEKGDFGGKKSRCDTIRSFISGYNFTLLYYADLKYSSKSIRYFEDVIDEERRLELGRVLRCLLPSLIISILLYVLILLVVGFENALSIAVKLSGIFMIVSPTVALFAELLGPLLDPDAKYVNKIRVFSVAAGFGVAGFILACLGLFA